MYKVRLVKELYEWKKKVENEVENGNKTDEKELYLLNKAITLLKDNYKYGHILPKKIYPSAYKEYSKKYSNEIDIDKLWVLKISSDWRIIYTVIGDEIDILSFILDSINHKKYDRKFHFSTS